MIRLPANAGLLLACALVLTGCPQPLPEQRTQTAEAFAVANGLQPIRFQTSRFLLQGFGTPAAKGPILTVYVEGDGDAFDRYGVTADPTPSDQVGLQLAAADSHRPILYLGRPCQYIAEADAANCLGSNARAYWSIARFSEAAIRSTEEAIADMMRRTGASRLVLVGFSGGGVMATLIAGRRYHRGFRDIDVLVTVASPIDHKEWTRYHDVTEMSGSEDPLTYLDSLRSVPQIHFSGGLDDIVPFQVVRSYIDKIGLNPRVRHVHFEDQDHVSWPSAWSEALGFVHAPYRP